MFAIVIKVLKEADSVDIVHVSLDVMFATESFADIFIQINVKMCPSHAIFQCPLV